MYKHARAIRGVSFVYGRETRRTSESRESLRNRLKKLAELKKKKRKKGIKSKHTHKDAVKRIKFVPVRLVELQTGDRKKDQKQQEPKTPPAPVLNRMSRKQLFNLSVERVQNGDDVREGQRGKKKYQFKVELKRNGLATTKRRSSQ